MTSSMRDKLNRPHPRMLRAGEASDPQLSGEAFKRAIGGALERAIGRSGMTKQELAFAMGYTDSAVIGRWTSGAETPQIGRLWAVKGIRAPFVEELAALAGFEIETTVRLRRTA